MRTERQRDANNQCILMARLFSFRHLSDICQTGASKRLTPEGKQPRFVDALLRWRHDPQLVGYDFGDAVLLGESVHSLHATVQTRTQLTVHHV